jgi:hypothetical protein
MATWDDAGYNNEPKDSSSPTAGDDAIRSTRVEVYERAKNEHTVEEDSESDGGRLKDWNHKQGSAKIWRQSAEPANRPNGSTALDSDDEGRLWIDTDNDLLYVYTGSAWEGVLRHIARVSIQGTLSTGSDVVPPIIFPRACTIKKVSARVGTDPTGAALQIDLNKNGSNSIFSAAFQIAAAGSSNSTTSFNASYEDLAADDYLTLDIDQVGSTVAGADLSITIEVGLG